MQSNTRQKARERAHKWRLDNPERYAQMMAKVSATRKRLRRECPDVFRGIKLRSRYGIELADYTKMFNSQGGLCCICKRANDTLSVDHDHHTGVVRGLLCGTCNRALGLMEDRADWLQAAVEYLNASR